MDIKEQIQLGKTFLGIELGSTRIKAALIGEDYSPIASGSHSWENRFEDGYWTYSLEDVETGLQGCFRSLLADVRERYGVPLETVGAMGVSAMMHGYLAFDERDELLVPFRTWRNTNTGRAAEELTELLWFNMPMRWSAVHLYQAVLDGEEHVSRIAHITTLAGYVHWRLTGVRAVGIGDASGIFPVSGNGYDSDMLEKYSAKLAEKGFTKDVKKVFPEVRLAGEKCGTLTEEGARFLDPSGTLKAGVPLCPPEGDAGTGMAAANAVRPGTGNVSAGTSIFSMVVLDKPPEDVNTDIDIVATPDGAPVAMVHCNNCCGELDAWVNIFGEFAALTGHSIDKSELYEMLYRHAMTGAPDCGGVTAYNFLSGEPVLGLKRGAPMYFRKPDSDMTLANFFRAQLCSAIAPLRLGAGFTARLYTAHGGLFKVKGTAQQILADALHAPVAVMDTAGEGGAWGMALLAAYSALGQGVSLADFLEEKVFAGVEKTVLKPSKAGMAGMEKYLVRYNIGVSAEHAAANVL